MDFQIFISIFSPIQEVEELAAAGFLTVCAGYI